MSNAGAPDPDDIELDTVFDTLNQSEDEDESTHANNATEPDTGDLFTSISISDVPKMDDILDTAPSNSLKRSRQGTQDEWRPLKVKAIGNSPQDLQQTIAYLNRLVEDKDEELYNLMQQLNSARAAVVREESYRHLLADQLTTIYEQQNQPRAPLALAATMAPSEFVPDLRQPQESSDSLMQSLNVSAHDGRIDQLGSQEAEVQSSETTSTNVGSGGQIQVLESQVRLKEEELSILKDEVAKERDEVRRRVDNAAAELEALISLKNEIAKERDGLLEKLQEAEVVWKADREALVSVKEQLASERDDIRKERDGMYERLQTSEVAVKDLTAMKDGIVKERDGLQEKMQEAEVVWKADQEALVA
ncbi:hypothetical protein CVT24_001382, partial [Panaeolus cyanescens]